MKKTLAIVVCVVFFSLSLIAVLSGIPHVHHDDCSADECPFCQFHSINPIGFSVIFESLLLIVFIICLIICHFNEPILSDKFCIRSFSSRAPPAF